MNFGQFGTLAAVSAMTGALKALQAGQAKLEATSANTEISADSALATLYGPQTTDVETKEASVTDLRLCGYCGLMLPVMEDVVLASRAAGVALDINGTPSQSASSCFTLRDLLTFSSVCGVGLDTVPVPGSITSSQLAAVYTETGALAYRLSKPLSCRLMPMQGLQAGEMTKITPEDNAHLTNTRVFAV